jgi:zinc protease
MMSFRKTFTLIFATILLNISLNAGILDNVKLTDQMPLNPNVTTGQFDNGMKYFIMENNTPENRAELQIVVKAGAVQEDEDQEGLAHFIEHMCFNGTENFPKNELISFLESTGMRFGGDVNANTGFDRTYYLLTIPMDKEGMLDDGLQVLEDWMSNVSFDPEELEKERQVILEEWRTGLNANTRVQKKHLPYMLYNSRYAERLPIGDTTDILNAPRDAFLRYYNEWYRPNISAVIAVGDFDKEVIEEKIKEHFSKLENPTQAREVKEYGVPLHDEMLISIAKDPELTYPMINIMFKHKGSEEGTYGKYIEDTKDRLISTMFSMRFQEFLQDPSSPFAMYAGGNVGGFLADLKAASLIGIPKNDRLKDAIETLLIEGFRAKKHGFKESELSRAKEQLMTMYESAYKEKNNTKSADYAREFFQYFYQDVPAPGIEVEYEVIQEVLPTITINDLNAIMDKMIRDKAVVITVSAPDKEGIDVPNENEIKGIYNKVKNMDIAAYEDVDTDKPLMSSMPKPGKVVEENEIDDVNIKEWKLSNGATVLIKKTDFKEDEILFRAYSPGGYSLAPKDLYLSASNASSIVDAAGISEFDTPTLQKMLSGKNLYVSPYIGQLTEGFRGSTSPDDLETFMQLLHLYFTNPRKDDKSFEVFKQSMEQNIENSEKNPLTALNDTISNVMSKYHYTGKPMTKDDIKDIDLKKAYDFYKERFDDASDFTFIFVGNVDEEQFKKMTELYIASLPAKNSNEKWKDIGRRMPDGKISKEVKKGIEPKSTVRLFINGTTEYDPDKEFELNSMIEVLRIRLREVIREDKGGVYGIGAVGRMQKYPYNNYQVIVYFGTAPDKVDDLVATVKEVFMEVRNGNFDEEYVNKAKEIMKRERETNLKENRYWLNNIYEHYWLGLDVRDFMDYEKQVEDIDKDMIVDAAKKYLDMDQFKEFILNPEG